MNQIDKNIPLPAHAGKGGAMAKYPFAEMDVGDSIFSENMSIRSAAYAFAKVHGIKFCCRAIDGGARIWRIA